MTLKRANGNAESGQGFTDEVKKTARKKVYAEPVLAVYGTVRGLTATGTGKQGEVCNTGGNSNQNDPGKSRC